MRLKIIYSGMILAALVFLAACNATDTPVKTNTSVASNTAPQTTHTDNARRITTAELETLIREGTAYIVDVRNQDSFDMGHIPGSRLIPASQIGEHVDELPRDKTIVTYCS